MYITALLSRITLIALLALVASVILSTTTYASVEVFDRACEGSRSEICQNQDDSLFGSGSIWNRIINTLIFLVGLVSILMIIVGGLRYITSNGDSASVTSAKNTILYAIVGLVIAISAYAIVNFVIQNLVR